MSFDTSSAGHPSKTRSSLLFLSVLGLTVLGGGYYWQQAGSKDAGAPREAKRGQRGADEGPISVAVETARRGEFPVYLTGLGTVTALKTVTVRPRVDGELIRVLFDEGQMVKQGDVLLEIDPRPFQIQLQQAEGQLLRDQALLKNAEIDLERYKTLLEQDSIAAQQTATQEALVKQYLGTVTMDQAQVNNAKLQLDYARVTAPVAGRVGLRQVDQGNIVRANDANGLLVITQLQPIDVLFTLPEDKLQAAIRRWRSNPHIKVQALDRSGKALLAEGKLIAIDNQIDPSTGTIKLKARFDNHEQTLFANQFVNIKMQLESLPDAIQVSSAAIQHDNDGAYLFVAMPDNTIQQRRVTQGPVEADRVVIPANLQAGEAVVIDGLDRLKAGSKIDIARKDGVAVAANPDDQDHAEQKFRNRDAKI